MASESRTNLRQGIRIARLGRSHTQSATHSHSHSHSHLPNARRLAIDTSTKQQRERERKGGGDLGGKIKMQNSLLFNIFDGAWLRPVSVFSLLYGNCPPAWMTNSRRVASSGGGGLEEGRLAKRRVPFDNFLQAK